MLALGIDPGIATLGYGLVLSEGDRLVAIDYGVLSTSSRDAVTVRLKLIYDGLSEIIARYNPTDVAVEQLFFAKNTKTALVVGQARGVALLAAANHGLGVSEYTPLQVKQSVSDYGRGDKSQVQTMVKILLGLKEIPEPDDAADALAVAICHMSTGKARRVLLGV